MESLRISPFVLSSPTAKQSLIRWVTLPPQNPKNSKMCLTMTRKGVGIRCGRDTSVIVGVEKELEKLQEEGKEGNEKGEMVELLECLEKEAIMCDDEGREPTDYNRRARIFDESSKVFQALKEHSSHSRVVATD